MMPSKSQYNPYSTAVNYYKNDKSQETLKSNSMNRTTGFNFASNDLAKLYVNNSTSDSAVSVFIPVVFPSI